MDVDQLKLQPDEPAPACAIDPTAPETLELAN